MLQPNSMLQKHLIYLPRLKPIFIPRAINVGLQADCDPELNNELWKRNEWMTKIWKILVRKSPYMGIVYNSTTYESKVKSDLLQGYCLLQVTIECCCYPASVQTWPKNITVRHHIFLMSHPVMLQKSETRQKTWKKNTAHPYSSLTELWEAFSHTLRHAYPELLHTWCTFQINAVS